MPLFPFEVAVTLILILSIALLNLLAGAGLAFVWEWYSLPAIPKPPPKPATTPEPLPRKEAAPEPSEPIESDDIVEETPPEPLTECVPEAWIDMLTVHAVEARSFIEATAHVLRLKVIAYRDQLAELEFRARIMPADATPADWKALFAEAIDMNGQWLNVQCETIGALVSRPELEPDLSVVAQHLEGVLLQQSAQIETSRMNLESAEADGELNSRTLVGELLRMLNCAHELRDWMQRSLAAILAAEQRFDEFEEAWQIDPMGGVANRAGLEILLHQWRSSEHHRKGPSSLVLFDMNRFAATNREYGTLLSDQILKEVTIMLCGSLRQERGFDRLARYSGQQFITILGGTTPDRAACAAERLRQLVDVAKFKCDGIDIPLQITCGIVELPLSEPMPDVIKRLERTLEAAKRHASNCTFVDAGSGPELIDPIEFEGEPPTIEIESKYVAAVPVAEK